MTNRDSAAARTVPSLARRLSRPQGSARATLKYVVTKDQVNDEHRDCRDEAAENKAWPVLREERKSERQEKHDVRLAKLKETLGV